MRPQNYFVYKLTNAPRHTVLYVGGRNNREQRASNHLLGRDSAFAKQYNAHKLVSFETFSDPQSTSAREKQLKNWSRARERSTGCESNPEWRDLFEDMCALK